jgi:hypothetical protein
MTKYHIPSKRNRELHEGGGKCFECTVYYRDDDNNSGNGDNAQVSYWYGPSKDAPLEPTRASWVAQ